MDRKTIARAALHYALLAGGLAMLAAWAAIFALPYNITESANRDREFYYYDEAARFADKPFLESFDSLVFRQHDPGFFMFATQTLMRLGLRNIYFLHLFSIAVNIGVLLNLYLLIRGLFHHRWLALFATLYVAFTCTFLAKTIGINTLAYARFFSLGAPLAYLYYLRKNHRIWLLLACLCYFLACWNYWERYIETGILLAGVHYVERRRLFSPSLIPLATMPVLAFALFMALLSHIWGSPAEAIDEVKHMAVLRSVDIATKRHAHHESYEYVNATGTSQYLHEIAVRIENDYYLPLIAWALMFALVLYAHAPGRQNAYRFFPFAFVAAFYWHAIMYQHVISLPFTSYYHYIFLALIFGAYLVEIPAFVYRRIPHPTARPLIAGALLFPILFPVAAGALDNTLPALEFGLNNMSKLHSLIKTANSPDQDISQRAKAQLAEELRKRVKTQRRERRNIALNALEPYFPFANDQPNLLPEGSFENWKDLSKPPPGFQFPSGAYSVINCETEDVDSGMRAVRQTWTLSDGIESIFGRFGAPLTDLKPCTDYSLTVRAKNLSNSTAVIAAWIAQGPEHDATIFRLKLRVILVPPAIDSQFHEYSGIFTTADAVGPFRVLLVTSSLLEDDSPPNDVIWDSWELQELGKASKFPNMPKPVAKTR